MPTTIIGLDIGGTKTSVVEGTRDARILRKTRHDSKAQRGFDHMFARMCDATDEALSAARAAGRVVKALSVSIGGPLDIANGIIYSPPHLPGWDAIPLKRLLSDRFGLPVYVEHDGNAGALAEWRFGAGQGVHSLIFLTMGTGLGGGIIVNDRLWRGASDLAGEVGHMRIALDGPLVYGKRGSWEGYAAGPAFARIAQQLFPARWGAAVTTPEITALAHAGDPDAVAVVTHVGEWLGRGLAVLADVLNPEMIVVGSMGVRLGDLLLEPARRMLRAEALTGTAEVCRVVPAALGESIGDVAALCAAIENLRPD